VEDYGGYYPFGAIHSQQNDYQHKYLFGGKELQTELDLGWSDFGVRCFDNWLAKWIGIDILAEYNAGSSPYAYTLGNPIRFSDPTGMISEDENGLMQVSTDLWGNGRNQDFMNQSANNAQQRAQTNQLQQSGYPAANANSNELDWLTNGQFQRDILDTYSFSENENRTTIETERELLGNDVRISYSWIWTGQISNESTRKLVFTGDYIGAPVGGLDIIGGGTAKLGILFFVNKNSNNATGKYATYVFRFFGKIFKVGKADAGRITKSSGLPTRVHQQLRKYRKKHGKDNVDVSVSQLGTTTTKGAKQVESSILKKIYKRLGFVPKGNKKSFKPKN